MFRTACSFKCSLFRQCVLWILGLRYMFLSNSFYSCFFFLNVFYNFSRSRHNIFGIRVLCRLHTGRPRNHRRFPGSDELFHQSVRTGSAYRRYSCRDLQLAIHFHVVSRLRMRGAVPHMPSRCAQG